MAKDTILNRFERVEIAPAPHVLGDVFGGATEPKFLNQLSRSTTSTRPSSSRP
jgi:hypothetical protein